MALKQQLQDDLKSAMREKDAARKRALRLVLAEIKNREVEVMGELSDDDVVAILQKEAKRCRETLGDVAKAGRPELAAETEAELEILVCYLPKLLGRQEITDVARQVIADLGAKGPRQMGQVMSALMSQLKGKADGKLVNEVVREMLTG